MLLESRVRDLHTVCMSDTSPRDVVGESRRQCGGFRGGILLVAFLLVVESLVEDFGDGFVGGGLGRLLRFAFEGEICRQVRVGNQSDYEAATVRHSNAKRLTSV